MGTICLQEPLHKVVNVWQDKEGKAPLEKTEGRDVFYMDFTVYTAYTVDDVYVKLKPFSMTEIIEAYQNEDAYRLWVSDKPVLIDNGILRYPMQVISHNVEFSIENKTIQNSLWGISKSFIPDMIE